MFLLESAVPAAPAAFHFFGQVKDARLPAPPAKLTAVQVSAAASHSAASPRHRSAVAVASSLALDAHVASAARRPSAAAPRASAGAAHTKPFSWQSRRCAAQPSCYGGGRARARGAATLRGAISLRDWLATNDERTRAWIATDASSSSCACVLGTKAGL